MSKSIGRKFSMAMVVDRKLMDWPEDALASLGAYREVDDGWTLETTVADGTETSWVAVSPPRDDLEELEHEERRFVNKQIAKPIRYGVWGRGYTALDRFLRTCPHPLSVCLFSSDAPSISLEEALRVKQEGIDWLWVDK